jgi:hypothetical protein
MPVTMLTTARIPIECADPECGEVRLYLVRDLVHDDTIACTRCRKPLDLSSDQWRSALHETAEHFKAVILS